MVITYLFDSQVMEDAEQVKDVAEEWELMDKEDVIEQIDSR